MGPTSRIARVSVWLAAHTRLLEGRRIPRSYVTLTPPIRQRQERPRQTQQLRRLPRSSPGAIAREDSNQGCSFYPSRKPVMSCTDRHQGTVHAVGFESGNSCNFLGVFEVCRARIRSLQDACGRFVPGSMGVLRRRQRILASSPQVRNSHGVRSGEKVLRNLTPRLARAMASYNGKSVNSRPLSPLTVLFLAWPGRRRSRRQRRSRPE